MFAVVGVASKIFATNAINGNTTETKLSGSLKGCKTVWTWQVFCTIPRLGVSCHLSKLCQNFANSILCDAKSSLQHVYFRLFHLQSCSVYHTVSISHSKLLTKEALFLRTNEDLLSICTHFLCQEEEEHVRKNDI